MALHIPTGHREPLDSLSELVAALSALEDPHDLFATASPLGRVQHHVYPPSVRVGSPSPSDFTSMFLVALQRAKVFFTESRRTLFERFAEAVRRLDMPKPSEDRLRGRGHCGVLVAQRGSGKSYLLKALAHAASGFSQRTFMCYLNYKTSRECSEPPWKTAIRLLTGLDPRLHQLFKTVEGIDHLHVQLARLDLRVVFLVDELEFVYGMPAEQGGPILADLIAVGEQDGPRTMLAFVTGTSSKIRRMCFVKLEPEEVKMLPSYNAMSDFNGRKYDAVELHPIASKTELKDAMQCMDLAIPMRVSIAETGDASLPAIKIPSDRAAAPTAAAAVSADAHAAAGATAAMEDTARLAELFRESRGVAQALDDLANSSSGGRGLLQGFMALKRTNKLMQVVWQSLIAVMQDRLKADAFGDLLTRLNDDIFAVTLPKVSLAEVRAVAGQPLRDAVLWDLSDMGFLHVEASACHGDGMAVAFLHVADFDWSVRNLLATVGTNVITYGRELAHRILSQTERDYFIHPSGKTGHEKLFAEALAYKYECVDPVGAEKLHLTYRWRTCALDATHQADVVANDSTAAWSGEIFTCVPDLFGTDLIAFCNRGIVDGRQRLVILCWQCKTGGEKSTIQPTSPPHSAAKIVERFTNARVEEALNFVVGGVERRAAFDIVVQKFVVTTCIVAATGGARQAFKSANITLIDRLALKGMWTTRIKDFLATTDEVKFMLS